VNILWLKSSFSRLGLLTCAVVCSTLSGAELPTGTIQGRVQTEAGKPVAGALVTAAPKKAPADGSLGKPFHVVSKPDGTFVFEQIPGNTYWLCARLSGSELLDPCAWSTTPPTVDISDGTPSKDTAITLKEGAFIHVRVTDPSHLVSTPSSASNGKADVKTKSTPLLLQVLGPRGLRQLQRVFDDDDGHVYRILVPFDTPLKLLMSPGALKVVDKNQNQLKASDQQQFTIPKGSTPSPFQFAVQP
jgi:hypothetical protein